jgi:hypothetical protein
MWFTISLLACGQPDPSGGPEAPPAARDPFNRVPVDAIAPSLDATSTRCEGDRLVVSADVAGRVHAARAVLVPAADGSAVALDLPRRELPEGSLWERYADEAPPATPTCDAAHTTTVIEVTNAAGALVDCVAYGAGAADVVAGRRDGQLAGVTHGDWSACRVR